MTSSAAAGVNWPPRFYGISRLHLSELRLWLCSSAAHPTLFTQVPRRGILRTSRIDGVLGSWAAEACRQAHGGRVLESPPNHGYHPTIFRKNSNRLWFLRLLPMLRADDAQPDGNRRMPDDSDFRADQRHTQRPDYDRADAVGKQRRDLSREVLSCGGTDLCRCWPHRP